MQSQTDLMGPQLCHSKLVSLDVGSDFFEPISSS